MPSVPGKDDILSFCVFGASGDLAKKKVYPAIFALFFDGRMHENKRGSSVNCIPTE